MKHPPHPAAALFPMLGDEELHELAESIKREGLLVPIVLDADGRVLDGRNRLAACQIAGVKPRFTTYEGLDPVGYALTVNIARRHMSKGAMAMVAALASVNSVDTTDRDLASRVGVSREYFYRAVTVIEWAPELVDAVLGGASLNESYDFAVRVKKEVEDKPHLEKEAEAWRQKAQAMQIKDRETLREQIRQTVESIGPSVPLASLPPLIRQVSINDFPAVMTAGATAKQLKEEKLYLDQLASAVRTLQKLRNTPLPDDDFADLVIPGIYACLTQAVEEAVAIAEQCNEALGQSKNLRRVK